MSSRKNLNHILGKVISMNLLRTFGIISDDCGIRWEHAIFVNLETQTILEI